MQIKSLRSVSYEVSSAMRNTRIINQSLIILLCCLVITIAIIAIYQYIYSPLENQTIVALPSVQKQAKSRENYQHEKQSEGIKTVVKPILSMEQPLLTSDYQFVPKASDPVILEMSSIDSIIAPTFSNIHLKHTVQTGIPKIRGTASSSDYVPSIKFPHNTSSKWTAYPEPKIVKPVATTKKRPMARTAEGNMKPSNLSMIKNIVIAESGSEDLAQSTMLGKNQVPSLPKGDPGGYIIGRGKDISGVLRFGRIKHNLADWWADQRSLISLIEWMNTQTKIKTDMNIEGGASLMLTDPKLSKTPLVFFTGHDPANVRSRNLMQGTPLKGRLSKEEKAGMRKYLIENGGFIFFDDCGVNAPAQEFLRLFLAQLRYAMPEYSVDRIPNDHEIYNNYYEMGGPPIGFDIFWWGTHPPKRNYLEGITMGDHLGVVVCRRDYMCATETVSMPSKTVHYSPGVLRFFTNMAIYALTHGGISDYSHYIPDNKIADRIPIKTAVLISELK